MLTATYDTAGQFAGDDESVYAAAGKLSKLGPVIIEVNPRVSALGTCGDKRQTGAVGDGHLGVRSSSAACDEALFRATEPGDAAANHFASVIGHEGKQTN